jgi:hypothetical protein
VHSDLGGVITSLPRDVVCAPRHILKQLVVTRLDSEKVITAIGRGAEDDPIPRPGKNLRGLQKQRCRQRRTVRI